MSKNQKWAIIGAIAALIALLVFLCGLFFERTLGPFTTFVLLAALCVVGSKWAGKPDGILSMFIKLPEDKAEEVSSEE